MSHAYNNLWCASSINPDSFIFCNLCYTYFPRQMLCQPIFNFLFTFLYSRKHFQLFLHLLPVKYTYMQFKPQCLCSFLEVFLLFAYVTRNAADVQSLYISSLIPIFTNAKLVFNNLLHKFLNYKKLIIFYFLHTCSVQKSKH